MKVGVAQSLIHWEGVNMAACAVCRQPFEARRPQAKYWGPTCRQRARRGVAPPVADVVPLPVAGGDLVAVVTAELVAAGREHTALGALAIRLAKQMAIFNTGGGLASLSKELRAVMSAALQNAAVAADPVDELMARRDAKRMGAR
jgi:hypothetical protein